MKCNWALPVAAALAGRALAAPCTQPVENCQYPDQLGHGAANAIGATSDENPEAGLAVRDNFVLEAGGTVNALCWWGFYLDFAAEADCGPGGVPDVFTVTYYTNVPGCDNGTPGPIKAGPFDVTATLGKAQTGNLIPSDFGDMVEYGYTATHPSVPVVAGECVWIEVRNDTTGSAPSCIWLWSTAPSAAEGGLGDGVSWQNDNLRDFDLAFCLNEPLGDPTNCNLMIDPGCQGAVNPCDEESPDPGCADACCCSLVCAEPGLAFCCDVVWDAACVEIALELCTNCGELGTGDCFEANFTPYCDDTCGGDAPCFGCCQRVCSADPFCCGDGDPPAWWDGWCAFQATQVCMCQPAQVPVNDDCADAIAIGLGDTPLDNTCASAGGPDHAQCTDGYLAGLGLDIWYTYTANFTGQLLVSTCDQVDYDTQLAVYEGCDCGALSDPPLGCSNDGAVCSGGSSLVVVDVVAGNCYTIRVGSSFLASSGTGTLTLSSEIPEPCDLDASIPPQALPEGEACGENTNGGCDNAPDPAAFTTVQADDIVHGTGWADGSFRDTDWYELVVTNQVEVTLTVEAEFPVVVGFAETTAPGSGDCDDATGYVVPSASAPACAEASVTLLLTAGTWWPFVAPNTGEGFPCPQGGPSPNDYILSISASAPCPWDCEAVPDGSVGVTDFLALLAQWGQIGTSCDFDTGGPGVGVGEFLDLLAYWGPCP
ncbi:MAG: hypothetical protein ACYTF2_10085 [Planctomycetota bacterium]|jgi:hypothetical protein